MPAPGGFPYWTLGAGLAGAAVLAFVEDRHDVGVAQARLSLDFALEALASPRAHRGLLQQELERDRLASGALRPKHHARAPPGDLLDDAIRPDLLHPFTLVVEARLRYQLPRGTASPRTSPSASKRTGPVRET